MGLFGYSLSFGFFRNNNKAASNTIANQPQPAKTKAISLPPETQKRLRRQRRREREADAESLDLLEIATAAMSPRAKMMDRESLKILEQATTRREESKRAKMVYKERMKKLERSTEHRERQEKCYETPRKSASCPVTPRLQGLNRTPLSYAPSFSTPASADRSASSESEGEHFLIMEAERKRRWEILGKSERRELRGAASGSSGQVGGVESKGRGAESVQELLGLFGKLEDKDALDEWDSIEHTEAPELSLPEGSCVNVEDRCGSDGNTRKSADVVEIDCSLADGKSDDELYE